MGKRCILWQSSAELELIKHGNVLKWPWLFIPGVWGVCLFIYSFFGERALLNCSSLVGNLQSCPGLPRSQNPSASVLWDYRHAPLCLAVTFFKNCTYLLCVCTHSMYAHAPWCKYGGQFEWVSSTLWVCGIKLRSPGFAANSPLSYFPGPSL